jgi:virulence factor Mce-like protein
MDTTNSRIQLKAGLFMLLGLICIGSLVLYFGRFSGGVKNYYTITVEYRNASGLYKGGDVLLAGAKIGEIADSPSILADMKGVAVPLKINGKVQIPDGSVFSIGSSGLLGDSFVTVTMSEAAFNQKPIPHGAVVQGARASSMADLQKQISEVMPKIDSAVENINVITTRLKQEVFNEQGVKNLQVTLSNFRTTSDALAASSGQIKSITSEANVFIKKGNETMDSAKGAAIDLKAFIANLRQHGVLFYRDSATSASPKR